MAGQSGGKQLVVNLAPQIDFRTFRKNEYDGDARKWYRLHLSLCKHKRDNVGTKGLTQESFPCRQIPRSPCINLPIVGRSLRTG